MKKVSLILAGAGLLMASTIAAATGPQLRIGSKRFTESYVLAEVVARELDRDGHSWAHLPGMGGTIILWQALLTGGIDIYPDYTGTISETILEHPGRLDLAEMRALLARHGIGVGPELGFDNTYALAVRQDRAQELGLQTIADLQRHPRLVVGLTHELLERQDGWRPLTDRYGLRMERVFGLEHALAYMAITRGEIDVMDAYSTDAKLAEHDLMVLEDNLHFFPAYRAVILYRLEVEDRLLPALERLAGQLDEATMIKLNAAAERTGDYAAAAGLLYGDVYRTDNSDWARIAANIARWTLRHLQLVGLSLLLAVLAGVPLGVRAARNDLTGRTILAVVGVIYTVPSLALLALLVAVPFLGIGTRTAIVALLLYSLLPIVRNTATGLATVPAPIRESAIALGLETRAQLLRVMLPMASPAILAGVRTSAVINVATATLAALIGVGGLGEPIISGLNLNDPAVILQGAVPAGVLAILVQLLFDGIERLIVPLGLRHGVSGSIDST
jgi:osmoprotectant transport system permease protein